MSSALEPVQYVSTSGIVDLIKRMSVRFLHCHSVARGRERKEEKGCLLQHEKLQFPVCATHLTPVRKIMKSIILEIWGVIKKKKKGFLQQQLFLKILEMCQPWAP